MKLAISNIAWSQADELAAAAMLQDFGLAGVELAPTTIWPTPLQATEVEISAYRNFWERRGIQIVSLQALLFGRPDLTIFVNPTQGEQTLTYLRGMIRLAAQLGASVLVFGSPKNRQQGSLAPKEAQLIAEAFFRRLGEVAAENGVHFCIEPNPVEYETDFITNAAEGLDFVAQLNQPGLGLHLDAAAMTLSRDSVAEIIPKAMPWLRHFHISEPYLAPVGGGGVDHAGFAKELRACQYSHWVSIEMKQSATPGLAQLAKALEVAKYHYE